MSYIAATLLFIWDESKSRTNTQKHGVTFELAASVFSDPLHISIPDRKAKEERWVTIGRAGNGKLLVVVHTYLAEEEGREVIRVISARFATKRERMDYEEGI